MIISLLWARARCMGYFDNWWQHFKLSCNGTKANIIPLSKTMIHCSHSMGGLSLFLMLIRIRWGRKCSQMHKLGFEARSPGLKQKTPPTNSQLLWRTVLVPALLSCIVSLCAGNMSALLARIKLAPCNFSSVVRGDVLRWSQTLSIRPSLGRWANCCSASPPGSTTMTMQSSAPESELTMLW